MNKLSSLRVELAFTAFFLVGIGYAFPWMGTTPLDDDWDFIADLTHLPFTTAVLQPANGQFVPLHKALYGAALNATGFDSWGVGLLKFTVRCGLAASVVAFLRAAKAWSFESALLSLAITFNAAGVLGVFRWPWMASLELSLLAYMAALTCLLNQPSPARSREIGMIAIALGCSIFSFGTGIGALAGLVVAAAVARTRTEGDDRLFPVGLLAFGWVLLWGIGATGGGSGAALIQAEWWRSHGYDSPELARQGWEVFRYWTYLTFANASPGGLHTGATAGLANGLFGFAVYAAGLIVVFRSNSRQRAFASAALIAANLLINLTIAGSRWPYGSAHAGSYRYVFINLFFQLLILAVCFADMRERSRSFRALWLSRVLAGLVLGIGLVGGRAAIVRAWGDEGARAACVFRAIQSDTAAACLSGMSGYQTPGQVRELLRIHPAILVPLDPFAAD